MLCIFVGTCCTFGASRNKVSKTRIRMRISTVKSIFGKFISVEAAEHAEVTQRKSAQHVLEHVECFGTVPEEINLV